jgi:hypothetical protein
MSSTIDKFDKILDQQIKFLADKSKEAPLSKEDIERLQALSEVYATLLRVHPKKGTPAGVRSNRKDLPDSELLKYAKG